MKTGTLKTIILLIVLLFLNIEAAHAGLYLKLKGIIGQHFPYLTLLLVLLLLTGLSFVIYALSDKSLQMKGSGFKKGQNNGKI